MAEKVLQDITEKAIHEGQDWLTGVWYGIIAGSKGRKALMSVVRGDAKSELAGFAVGIMVRPLMFGYAESKYGPVGRIVADIIARVIKDLLPGMEEDNGSPGTDS